jgi:molecular chaperone GrpE (heat shock protein)
LEGDLARVLQRHEADKAALSAQARADVFAKLLPLLDNFERAAQSLPNKTEGEAAIHHRYQAIYKQTQELLR